MTIKDVGLVLATSMSSSKASKRPPNEVESRLHKAAISDPKNVRYVRLMSTETHDVAP